MEAGGIAPGKRKLTHQLTAEDLIGRVVLIDISGRVQAELDKNGGKPSPDKSVTDFSNSSPNVVGADSGESGKGDDDKWTNSWHAHVRLLQRGLLFVENAANLDLLAQIDDPSKCLLAVGAPKHVRGTGGPSRVMAICN